MTPIMRCSSKTLVTLVSCVVLALGSVSAAPAACTTPGSGCAIDFGTNGHVTFGSGLPDLGVGAVTLETWFRRDGTGATVSTGTGGVTAIPLVTKGRGEGDNSNLDMNYFLGIRGSDNRLAADFEEGAGGTTPGLNHPVAGTTAIATGIWYHAAATYDGTTWRLYLNGMLEAELAVGQPLRADSVQHAGLATAMTSTGATSGSFDGVLDEVRIWSYARTQAEIQATINQEVASASGLVGRWGLNEGTGATAGDSAGVAQNGTIVGTQGTNWDWTNGSPFNANLAPAAPTLNAPADGATGVATTPTLDVSVADPEGSPLTVTFWGREATTLPDFTIIALPDTQHYVDDPVRAATFTAQTEWIVAQKSARNIVFVSQLGDCVENGDNGGNPIEWQRADASISVLENPLTTLLPYGIPYGITVGNHDQSPIGDPDGTTTFYNQFFGEARFLGRPYYGGHYGVNNDNHYELFSASGMDFIVVNLEYDTSPDAAVLAWANGLLQTHSTRRAIIVSHWFVNTGNPGSFGAQGQATYDALKGNPNLFLMLSGHVPGEGRRQDTFNGRTVNALLADYQSRANGGNGWLRILTFSPSNNTIAVETYSPTLDQYETDADSQFTLSYDMGGAGFAAIATVSNVPSGSAATVPWPSLDPGTDYEWYVTVGDGTGTTAGPIWSFTTTAGCGDGVVDGAEQCDDGNIAASDGCSATCEVEACHACVGQPSACTPITGGSCDDGSLCTSNDTCSSGACVGGPPPNCDDANVCTTDTCTALVGCVYTNNVASCDDGLFCNGADVCGGGSCGHAGDPCVGGSECNDTCNETADSCAVANGTPCTDDGNVCTSDQCSGAGTCAHVANMAPCDDGLFCNGADICGGGSCGHAGDPCAGGSACNDVCNEAVDNCFNVATSCDDGLFCNGVDTCGGGTCGHAGDPCAGGPECNDTCDEASDGCADAGGTPCTPDGDVCTDDQCDGAGTCAHPSNTAPCDDANACTEDDVCSAGVCAGTSGQCGDGTLQSSCNEACDDGNTTPGDGCNELCGLEPCAAAPAPNCLLPAVGQKAQLKIKDNAVDTKDQLQWKWSKGDATALADFGDPLVGASYHLCVYDTGMPLGQQLVSSTLLPAGGTCAGKPCWKASKTGYQYKDKDLTPDGGAQLRLKAGAATKALAQFKGKGEPLHTPALPLTGPVRVQLKQTSGAVCWEAVYSPPFKKNDALGGQFFDKAD